METLQLYKEREHTLVTLRDPKNLNKQREFKIPNEYTVEEMERVLELQIQRQRLESQEVEENDAIEAGKRLKEFWRIVFDQLSILFQHYQPEITADDLRKILTQKEASELVGFYKTHRFTGDPQGDGVSKKKLQKMS